MLKSFTTGEADSGTAVPAGASSADGMRLCESEIGLEMRQQTGGGGNPQHINFDARDIPVGYLTPLNTIELVLI